MGAGEPAFSLNFEPACVSHAHLLCLAGRDRQAAERNLRPGGPLPVPGGKTGADLGVRARVGEPGQNSRVEGMRGIVGILVTVTL